MIKSRKTVSVICMAMVLSLSLSLMGGAFAVTQSEIDSLKQQQEEVNNKKKALSGKIGELQGKVEEAMNLKAVLDEQNTLTYQEIELINERIALYEGLVEQKAQELEEAKAAEQEQKEQLRIRMRKMEERSDVSYISILFKATSFTDLLSRIDSINSIMERDKHLEDDYIAAREHVEEVKAEYEATLADCEDVKVELEAKKAELEAQIEEAKQVIKDLEKDIEETKKQYDQFVAETENIGAIIAQKEKELEEQQKQIIDNGGTVITGTGTYTWPLPGIYPSSNSYGMRLHPIFNEWRFHAGTDIGAASGTPIHAADSGTVTIAGVGSGYGNYVTISHGGGRSTLYAHMSSIACTTGQQVNQGDVIGYVGSTGWSTGPHLHFEVRVNGATTDPMSYF